MDVRICKGLGVDDNYYVSLGKVTVVISKVGLFKLGLAFYHVAMGNWELDDVGERVDVPELRVVCGLTCYNVKSSKTPKSASHQFLVQTPTTPRAVTWLLFETRLGGLALSLLERVLGLAVAHSTWLGELLP